MAHHNDNNDLSMDSNEEMSNNNDEEKLTINIYCELEEVKEVDSDDGVVFDNEGKFEVEEFNMVVDDDDMNVLIDNTNNYVEEEEKGEEENEGGFAVRNGYYYEGEIFEDDDGHFNHGRRHGLGTMFYPNGDTYEGMWQFNKRHGRGIYKQLHGETIEALWENDCVVHGSVVICLI